MHITVKYDLSPNKRYTRYLYFKTGRRDYKLNTLTIKTLCQKTYGLLKRINIWENAVGSCLCILWLLQKTIESFDWRDERRLRWKSSSNKCLQHYITMTLTSHSVVDIRFNL
jgi:hypothetical protein